MTYIFMERCYCFRFFYKRQFGKFAQKVSIVCNLFRSTQEKSEHGGIFSVGWGTKGLEQVAKQQLPPSSPRGAFTVPMWSTLCSVPSKTATAPSVKPPEMSRIALLFSGIKPEGRKEQGACFGGGFRVERDLVSPLPTVASWRRGIRIGNLLEIGRGGDRNPFLGDSATENLTRRRKKYQKRIEVGTISTPLLFFGRLPAATERRFPLSQCLCLGPRGGVRLCYLDRMGKPDKKQEKAKARCKPERGEELPWDLFDRCLLPIIFSHAAAVVISAVLNTLCISQVSAFSLFLLFVVSSLAGALFYHTLKVSAAGKCVFVTSCDSRLGIALVKQLDDLGFTVFAGFAKRNDEAEKLKEVTSGRLHVVELDVTDERQVLAVAAHIRKNLPPKTDGLWALVNTAQSAPFGEVEWVPVSVFRQAVEVNLLSAINITQTFLPLLRRTKGRVINIGSILGRIPSPVRSPYCAANYAVEGFSKCLRLEMKRWGVDVVVVEPGDYTTASLWFNDSRLLLEARNMWRQMPEEVKADYGKDYFEYKVRTLQEYARGAESDLIAVVRSLTDAVCRTFPLSRYTPVTREEKLQAFVSDHFPRSVYDVLYN